MALKSRLLPWPSTPAPSASAQPQLWHFLHLQAPPKWLLLVSLVPGAPCYPEATMLTAPLSSSPTLPRVGSFSSFGLGPNVTSSKKPSLTTWVKVAAHTSVTF